MAGWFKSYKHCITNHLLPETSRMEPVLSEHADHILRYSADLLLQIGGASEWPVTETSLDTGSLNTSIREYQRALDGVELRVIHALRVAKEKLAAEQAKPVSLSPTSPVQPGSQPEEPIRLDDDRIDELGAKEPELGTELDASKLDTALGTSLDDIDANGGELPPQFDMQDENGLATEFDYFKPGFGDNKFESEFIDDDFSDLRF